MGEKRKLNTIKEGLRDIKEGKIVILVDDEDRKNEGSFVMAAEKVTPEAINFMTKYGNGIICLSLTPQRVGELELPMMTEESTSIFDTAFTVSIDAKEGIKSGGSSFDRARTILTAIDPSTKPQDLRRPGHVFPLKAREGGVLERAGKTEGAIDLARLAGMYPAGVLCDVMSEDGSMPRLPELQKMAEQWQLKLITVEDLIRFRLKRERLVSREAETMLPTPWGEFNVIAYSNKINDLVYLALIVGEIGEGPIMVRIHRHCLTGNVFRSTMCDCNLVLREAMKKITSEGSGVLVYICEDVSSVIFCDRKRILGNSANTKLTTEKCSAGSSRAIIKDYGIGAQVLRDLGIRKIRLLTNNPSRMIGLGGYGLKIVEYIPVL